MKEPTEYLVFTVPISNTRRTVLTDHVMNHFRCAAEGGRQCWACRSLKCEQDRAGRLRVPFYLKLIILRLTQAPGRPSQHSHRLLGHQPRRISVFDVKVS